MGKNFLILTVFATLIYSVSIYVYYQKSQQNAIEQAVLHTEDFLRSTKAAKKFYKEDIKQKLKDYTQNKHFFEEKFIPELHSCAYSSKKMNTYYNEIRAKEGLPPIKLQFLTDNPRNPNNIISNNELKVLHQFQDKKIDVYQKILLNADGTKTLYYAQAGAKLEKTCLECHGYPTHAPKALIKEYGAKNGFYHKEGDIRAFIKVLMPLDKYLEKANELFFTRAIASFLTIFIILILIFILLKKSQKESKKFQSVIDTLNEIVIIQNTTDIISVNRAFLNFFNVKDKKEFQAKYSNMTQTLCLEDKDVTIDLQHVDDKLISLLNSIDKTKRIFSIQNAKGETKKLTIKIHKLNDNEYVIVLSDITKIQNRADMLEQKANIDSLTKALSRQKFDELYSLELHRSQRYINSLSVMLLDIDHFKNINDTYGHDIGDKALIDFAKLIKEGIRKYDVFARWGGEEFILMLPQTDINAAFKMGEKLRNIIKEHNFEKIGKLTCSIGISMLRRDDDESTLLKRIDNALYKAKKSGRDKTIIYL